MLSAWVKRHAILVLAVVAVGVTVAVCLALEHAEYLRIVAQDVTPDLDPEMRWRMEFHAAETANFGFLIYLVTAAPFMAGVILIGAAIITLRRKADKPR
ncbi:MAG: hypothetical protein ABL932_15740 [Terricaulis sp.]